MANLSGALDAKAKALYGQRLKENDYDELIRKKSISDMVEYLKNQTAYHDILSEINPKVMHRKELEGYLEKEYFLRLSRLMHYGQKTQKAFYHFGIIEVEIGLIFDKLISLKEKESYTLNLDIPDYLNELTSFNMYDLINIKSYLELLSFLKNTRYYTVLSRYSNIDDLDLTNIEKDLYRLYYQTQVRVIKRNFKGSIQSKLLTLLYVKIDLSNLSKIYRFKTYFKEDEDFIKSSLFLEYTRIKPDMMEKLINARDNKELLNLLAQTRFHLYEEDNDFKYIEYYMDGIQYNIAKRFIWFGSDAPVVYFAYAILQFTEVTNLKHIIEGIRYGKTPNEIKDSLIIG